MQARAFGWQIIQAQDVFEYVHLNVVFLISFGFQKMLIDKIFLAK